MIDGTLKTDYKSKSSRIIDGLRILSIIILFALEENHKISFIFIGIYLIL